MLATALHVGCGEDTGDGRKPFTDIGAGLVGVRACSLAWGDYDNDGDLDLALAGSWRDETWHCESKVYRNDRGTFTDIGAELMRVDAGSVTWADYDSDGDLDLVLTGRDGPSVVGGVYRNEDGAFTEISVGLRAVMQSSLAWGDYDSDGDLDLALAGWTGNTAVTKVYRNDGGRFTDIRARLVRVYGCSLAWGDYDSDGDLDLALAGTEYARGPNAHVARIYRNEGGGAFVDADVQLRAVWISSLAWGDYDLDGDLDLALAGWDGGDAVTAVYRNDAGSFSDIGAGLTGVQNCSLAWGDYDNDGYFDLALAGEDGEDSRFAGVYRNCGGGVFTLLDSGLTHVQDCSLAWGDYDNDGNLDLAVGGSSSARPQYDPVCKIYRNAGHGFNTQPTAPTGLSAKVAGGDVTFSWNAATDAQTPQPGLSYNLRVWGGSGEAEVMPAIADWETGRLRTPAMGNVQHNTSWTLNLPSAIYHWSVQAVDTAFEGSPWASEQTVTVP